MTRKIFSSLLLGALVPWFAFPKSAGAAPSEGNQATPVSRIKALEGFQVELLYSVPGEVHGSWVALCTDPKGRIIAADQYGSLYRFAPPASGAQLSPGDIEKVGVDIKAANGLLWAFDALYVAVNDYQNNKNSGVYRVTDSDGDDRLDRVERLRAIMARGDHGVHAILPSPDGESLFLITGNNTDPTPFTSTRVPLNWGEDHLLPRMPDGRGHNRDRLAPGGIIYRFSPDGEEWEAWSSGYRNIYDGGFNKDGELFTYDADMEYDFNTPWYRPTRVCHATSGSEYGWRNGTGKRQEWLPDNLPPVLNIGPGSPTGTTFGYGAKFPARYQEAFFVLDWSWGKLYAVHLQPEGSSYTATKEEFISGTPLPLTDAIIHPRDGAMYFAIGGRKVQSGLYRVSYTGDESTAPVRLRKSANRRARELRHKLEDLHLSREPQAVDTAWPHLDHDDRFIRWAARVALEHQPLGRWSQRALREKDHGKRVEALLGLVRAGGIDPFHRQPSDPPVDEALRDKILASLQEVNWDKLNQAQKLTLVRAYQICFIRFGRPDEDLVRKSLAHLDPQFPAGDLELNALLCETLVYLQSPHVAAEAMALLEEAPTQEEQMEFARSLRMLKAGWTTELRTAYFEWFLKAANYRGGASFEKFIEFIRNDALATLTPGEREVLQDVLAKEPERKSPLEALAEALAGRSFVKEWTMDELASAADKSLKNRDFENGRRMFGAVGCFACHRFANQGGMTGPDLTGAAGRYSARDLLDQIIHPSKEINEQFVPVVLTLADGDAVTGIIVNLNGDNIYVNTDPANPNQQERVDRKKVEKIETASVSPMPEGLLNMLDKPEIMDLLAYILSGGNPEHRMFR